ncbi:hypothetical protein R6Q57_001157 [Mikania cordata]
MRDLLIKVPILSLCFMISKGFGTIKLILVRVLPSLVLLLLFQVYLSTSIAKLFWCLELEAKRDETKTRKPYTITKQRERWTEDEHNSFLEALKLYGRAWQRIEEHIGTKTAVQIRSHAQKFFTKLEKEAVAKGIPIGQAIDMEIPPPRPKRKPSYPYPRKTDPQTLAQLAHKDDKQSTLVTSLKLLDLESKPLPEKTSHKEKIENEKANDEFQNGTTEGPQEAPFESLSLENENSSPNESHITNETRKHQELDQDGIKNTDIMSNVSLFESSHKNIFHGPYSGMQGLRICPRHVPVQLVDVNQGTTAKDNNFGEVYEHPNPNPSVNISAASETSGHHNNVAFHPLFTPFSDNQESYRSFLHFASTISGLIVSSLLQNPAAHAAASFAAKFWHPVNTDASADSFSKDHEANTTPSMTAIAAATVAAATAWWSAHGLLPVCTPFYHGGHSCRFGTPVDGNLAYNGRDTAAPEDVLQGEKMDEEKMESAADFSSSDDSEKKLNTEVIPVDTSGTVSVEDLSKSTNAGKQVDRSSCGSNTTSSSEIETGVLKKHGKETLETKSSDVKESISRRGRSTITPNESWKEVSEEATLFSREVLPQSFSDTHKMAAKDQQNMVNKSELDLNRMSKEPGESTSNGFAVLRRGSGGVKLSHHRTGFKPYKRCSVEAKESSKIVSAGNQNDENGSKRMRLEAEVST